MAPPLQIRVGIVPYLNMLPLVHGLPDLRLAESSLHRLCVEAMTPSVMTERMEAGRLDLGMLPVGGLVDHPEWKIAVGASGGSMIGSRGAVMSVSVVGAGPPEQWKLLHPDSHSRTSNVLARILLARLYGVHAELGEPIAPEGWSPPERPQAGEAWVLIGTRALEHRDLWREAGAVALDLGEIWTDWTGLPFVYAVWAARPEVDLGQWMEKFEVLKRTNRSRLPSILPSRSALAEVRLTESEALSYLTENIHFDLDEAALAGLERFHVEGVSLGLFAPGWVLGECLGSTPSAI